MSQKNFNSVIIPPKIAGIKSSVPMFTLAWHINQSFGMNLACNLDWEKEVNTTIPAISFHQHYFDVFEDVELNWHLMKNKGSESWFFQSKPMFDYLFICNGDDIYNYFERAVNAIKQNPKIEFVHAFDFGLIKSKDAFFNNILKTKLFIDDLSHV
ncbi:MAG: hypothetical protein JNM67_08785 [Bacteroidetes bacterium]|nr:hypothetical protein [Bacteroidota bacterium]